MSGVAIYEPSVVSYRLDEQVRRNRVRFQILLGSIVLVCAFMYGFCKGLYVEASVPFAEALPGVVVFDPDDYVLLTPDKLADGMRLVPFGSNVEINGISAEIASFTSSRAVPELMVEQVTRWERAGYEASGATTRRYGLAFAIDERSGAIFYLTAWRSPTQPNIVQGFVSARMHSSDSGSVEAVPGIPTLPGGKVITVFSSQDRQGQSYSAIYASPKSVARTASFYKMLLNGEGWVERSEHPSAEKLKPSSLLEFVYGEETIALLLTPATGVNRVSGMDTIVNVSKIPFL